MDTIERMKLRARALARWESEGGALAAADRPPADRGGTQDPRAGAPPSDTDTNSGEAPGV